MRYVFSVCGVRGVCVCRARVAGGVWWWSAVGVAGVCVWLGRVGQYFFFLHSLHIFVHDHFTYSIPISCSLRMSSAGTECVLLILVSVTGKQ